MQTVSAQTFFPKEVYSVPCTVYKDQAYSSTCWSFATTSFIESELIRNGKPAINLSEMYFVRCIWPWKAENFVRWHAAVFFTPGGQPHDVMRAIKEYGFVTESSYKGLKPGSLTHDHEKLDSALKRLVVGIVERECDSLCKGWLGSFSDTVEQYLGVPPEIFFAGEMEYTPKAYADSSGFDPDDYIEITSFSHQPPYKFIVLEDKYNWSHDLYWNVPFEDFIELFDIALSKGYSLIWNGDADEEEFLTYEGLAIVPLIPWKDKTSSERLSIPSGKEKEVTATASLRQQWFDKQSTTVNHVMHIVGLVKNSDGKKYYKVKNSWGDPAKNGGFIYLSEAYLLLKTVSVMVNKEALSPALQKKLNLNTK